MSANEHIKILEKIEKQPILDKLHVLEYDKKVKSSYAPNRVEKWFGYSSNLQSIKDGRSCVEWTENFPFWINELRNKYFKESDSVLVCKGIKSDSDTSIDWHRDHGNFHNRVVMVNYGKAIFYLQTYDDGTVIVELNDGDVVDFDSKMLHKSSQLSMERYIITFRKVKREYLNTKLF